MREPAVDLRPRPQSLRLVRASVSPTDRILITGASGWFGRTMLALLWHAHGPVWVDGHVLAGASAPRSIDVLGCGPVRVRALNAQAVAAFAPTLVVNCAFPTRDRVTDLGHDTYVATARGLTRNLLEWAAMRSVERVITLSSGAAVPSAKFLLDLFSNPYGYLKAEEEHLILGLAAELGFHAQVCRVWAVSGPHVQHPRNYALSGFIVDGIETGVVHVQADRPVIRSYVPVEDALAVALAAAAWESGVFDTGGPSVEIGEVAAQVGHFLDVPVQRMTYDPSADADDYRGDSAQWEALARLLGLETPGVDHQIATTAAGLMAALRS